MTAPTQSKAFWSALEHLVLSAELVIDRPAGTAHPGFPDTVYPLDYGFLEGTQAGDGDGIDVWVGTMSSQEITGVVCTVDAVKHDAEIKILLGCTEADVRTITAFHSQGSMVALAILRDA